MKNFLLNNIKILSTTLENSRNIFNNLLSNSTKPELVTTFNLDFLRIAENDTVFKDICQNAFANFPDGIGITSLIKMKYGKNIRRITGNDLFMILLELSSKFNKRMAIIGGFTEVADKIEQKILSSYEIPRENLLYISPENNFEQTQIYNDRILKEIIDFQPDIVCAALGCPRQERWLYENMQLFGSKINIGLGATLDYFTKCKKRSPKFFQSLGIEWFWRFMNEPKRLFKRYFIWGIPFYLKCIKNIYSHN